ncbi:hypothetical protein OKN36_17540 [Furfurilactobacillus sp. OKN36]
MKHKHYSQAGILIVVESLTVQVQVSLGYSETAYYRKKKQALMEFSEAFMFDLTNEV